MVGKVEDESDNDVPEPFMTAKKRSIMTGLLVPSTLRNCAHCGSLVFNVSKVVSKLNLFLTYIRSPSLE